MSDTPNLSSVEARVSYGIGRQLGNQLRSNAIEGLDLQIVTLGLQHGFDDLASLVADADLQQAFDQLQQQRQAAAEAAAREAGAAGVRYLEENAKKAGVEVTASGLQYEVLVAGDGAKPVASSTVRTHYHGTFIDGKVFDSSVNRGQPAEFPVSGVIAGWTEALQLMNVGSKWRLHVPAELAYGSRGAPGAIPPHSTLIFEVELLDIL